MSVKTTGNLVHDSTCNLAEMTRQIEIAAAGSNMAAALAADIKFCRACIASSRTNNNSADIALHNAALRSLGVWT